MGADVLELTDADFERAVQEPQPIMVDFWAAWCPPCRMISPLVDSVAEEYRDRLRVGKLNVDENPATARGHAVRSIPTLILFREGKETGRLVGVVPREAIRDLISKVL